jgi:hypothetical protein
MMISRSCFDEIISGFNVMDGTLGYRDNGIGFILQEDRESVNDEDPRERRLLTLALDREIEDRDYLVTFKEHGTNSMISSTWLPNTTEFLITDTGGNILSFNFNGGNTGYEDNLPGHPVIKLSTANKICRVHNKIFICGSGFRLYKRIGYQSWKFEDIPPPKLLVERVAGRLSEKENDTDASFDALHRTSINDIDGFSLSDLYAVCDKGVIWYFDGNTWTILPFLSNRDLFTVCCADDGNVYISSREGMIFYGRNDQWKLLVKYDNLSIPYFDSAWFAGRLWCANDYGMWALEGKKMVPCQSLKNNPVPYECAYTSGRIDISPDKKKMLICGQRGASLFDGEKWEVLFHTGSYD